MRITPIKKKSKIETESKNEIKTESKVNISVNNEPSTSSNSQGSNNNNSESKCVGRDSGNYTTSGTNNGNIAGEKTGKEMGKSYSNNHVYELNEKKMEDSVAKNNQLIAILGIVFLILLVILGYKHKNNDNF